MKIALFGGSFSPLHMGHLIMAEHCLEIVDKVIFIPTYINPFKIKTENITEDNNPLHKKVEMLFDDVNLKFELLNIAISGNPRFEASDVEISKKEISYTINTVREMKKRYPNDDLYFINGADTVMELDRWREFENLAKLVTFIAIKRTGIDEKALDEKIQFLIANYNAKIIAHNSPYVEISSSYIRERIKDSKSIRYMVPETVEHKIYEYLDK